MRRRVVLTVLTALRFKAGLKHPKRLRRVDSFSYFIPSVLDKDLRRFVDTQKQVAILQQQGAGAGEAKVRGAGAGTCMSLRAWG